MPSPLSQSTKSFYTVAMNYIWLLRASKWLHNPPSLRRVLLVGAVIVACLGIYGIEQIWGWPEWLTPDRSRGRLLR